MAGPAAASGKKRSHDGGGQRSDAKRKKNYFTKGAAGPMTRTISHGSRGFLVTCEPRQETRALRESGVIITEHIAARHPELAARLEGPSGAAEPAPEAAPEKSDATPAAAVSDALAAEVKALREVKKEKRLLQNVDLGIQGAVFQRVADGVDVAVADVVERLLRAARESKVTGTRNCVRFVPVHATCYAKESDAAEYAAKVCLAHFPKGKCTYGIQFRSRLNTGAKRLTYIKAVADAVEASDPGRFSVDLSSPDVVLCVEILKTQCIIGAVGKYYHELSKLNIREVVKSPEAVAEEKKEQLERQARNLSAKAAEEREAKKDATKDLKEGGDGVPCGADAGAEVGATSDTGKGTVVEEGTGTDDGAEGKTEKAVSEET